MDGFERVSVPAVPIPIPIPRVATPTVCAWGQREGSGTGRGAAGSGAWFQTGNIGHLVLEIKHGCRGGRRVQMSKYRERCC